MGVKGLWSLLNPVARPVQIESLEGKRLAIDSSIWLYQFQSTMRDKDGRVLVNAHVLGFLRRINRLLFHGIKPVFVFDGGAPALKRSTIAERKRKKTGAAFNAAKMAEKLLQAQMRREALRVTQQAEAARVARAAQSSYVEEGGESIPENAVYLDQLESTGTVAGPSTSVPAEPQSQETKRKKFKRKDRYELPAATVPAFSTEEQPDARLATEEELRQFIDNVHPEDIDIESAEFRALPTEVQYEIIGDLRVKSRQQSHKRLTDMLRGAPTALDFSKAQIKHLSQRNALTQQLLTVTDMVSKAHLTIPIRVASERNRQYLLVKRDNGSGWALGIREGTKERPIVLEPETEADRVKKEQEDRDMYESGSEESDSDIEEIKPPPDDDLRRHRRRQVLEAIAARYVPVKAKPSRDVHVTPFGKSRAPGAVPLFDAAEDDLELEEPDITANDKELALALQKEELGDGESEADPELVRALALSREVNQRSGTLSLRQLPDSDEEELEEVSLVPSGTATPALLQEVEDSDDDLVEVVDPVTNPPAVEALMKESIGSSSGAAPETAQREVIAIDSSEDEFEEVSTQPQPTPCFEPPQPKPRTRPNLAQLVQMSRPKEPSPEPSPEQSPPPQVYEAPPKPSRSPPSPSPSPSPPPRRAAPTPSPEAEDVFRRGAPSPSPEVLPDPPSVPVLPTTEETQPPVRYEFDSEEEEDFLEWSRSPTPQPRTLDPHSSTQSVVGSESFGDDEEMAPADMVTEEDDYARFLASIKNRDLNEVRGEIDDEIRILNAQAKVAMRDSDEITQAMVVQIQTLLRHFGIPYITAPMEAEAQCAKLAQLGLVDGIITDDSDVFLFGGTQCFKNVFNDAKFAECFLATDIQREMCLPRERLITLAYLLGSDYTLGITGVGPVLALELLANFPGPNGLSDFKEWWLRVQRGDDTEEETNTKFKRSFKKRFVDVLQLSPAWPDPLVRDAYLHPTADESDEPFSWGFPRLAALRTFLHEELSWSISKVDDELTPIVQRIAQRGKGSFKNQATLLPYFDNSVTRGGYVPRRATTANMSKRLIGVINQIRAQESGDGGEGGEVQREENGNDAPAEQEPQDKGKRKVRGAPRKGKSTGKKRNKPKDDDAYGSSEEPAPKRRRSARTASTAPSDV